MSGLLKFIVGMCDFKKRSQILLKDEAFIFLMLNVG